MAEPAAKIAKIETAPEYFVLNNEAKMPSIGLGTWKAFSVVLIPRQRRWRQLPSFFNAAAALQAVNDNEVGDAVKWALAAGYRHIDCAACYGNEVEVGAAMKVRERSPSDIPQ